MPETITFTEVAGAVTTHDVTVYALSTCGFCRRAIEFLKTYDVAFRYLHVDLLEPGLRQKIKAELAETYNERITYPFTIVDGREVLIGFVEQNWKLTLGLS